MADTLKGRCLCGQVEWVASAPPLWSAHCHCESCRRAASAGFVSWIGFARNSVKWSGERKFYRSSKKVKRCFCPICGTPLGFETTVLPQQVHLYAVSLDNPEFYQASGHLYWSEKLNWVHIEDSLPKHEKGLQAATKEGKNIL